MRRGRDVSIVTYQVRWLRPGLDITRNPAHGQGEAIGLEVCALGAASGGVVAPFLMRLAPSSQPGEDDRIRSLRQGDAGLSEAAELVATSISAHASHPMPPVDWF